ncbi:MAG: peptidylprolyl isomerase [Halothiobacillaceae bacterium]|nr:peptidylprolyl isomerase [Halothiobacillaceae bacterium]
MNLLKKPLILAMTATLLLAGCGQNSTPEKAASTPTTAAPVEQKDILAIVNGDTITVEEFNAIKLQLPPQAQANDEQVLNQLIELKALAQKAEADGLAKEAAIQSEIERAKESILANHLVKRMMKDMKFTDEQLKKEYDELVTKLPKKQEMKAAHILVENEEQAKEIQKKVNEGGDFAELAKANSIDPGSKDQGGDLGWFEAGMMVPEFSAAASALKPGETTKEPVKSQFGWHIIKLEETRDVPPPAFEAVKPQVENMMQQKAVEKLVNDTRAAAKVEIKKPAEPAAKPAEAAPVEAAPAASK